VRELLRVSAITSEFRSKSRKEKATSRFETADEYHLRFEEGKRRARKKPTHEEVYKTGRCPERENRHSGPKNEFSSRVGLRSVS